MVCNDIHEYIFFIFQWLKLASIEVQSEKKKMKSIANVVSYWCQDILKVLDHFINFYFSTYLFSKDAA